jgi:hypothetical protein
MKGMGSSDGAKGMHADMAQHKQAMADRLDMMQTMLEMIMQRLPDPAAPPAVK